MISAAYCSAITRPIVWSGLVIVVKRGEKEGSQDKDREARLDELGFIWDIYEHKWNARFKELEDHKEHHGDCNVPQRWAENQKLGDWVSKQRMFRKNKSLDQPKISKLNELGFVWDIRKSCPRTT